jgi:hypothetical protein
VSDPVAGSVRAAPLALVEEPSGVVLGLGVVVVVVVGVVVVLELVAVLEDVVEVPDDDVDVPVEEPEEVLPFPPGDGGFSV